MREPAAAVTGPGLTEVLILAGYVTTASDAVFALNGRTKRSGRGLFAMCPRPVVDAETFDPPEVPRVARRDSEPVGHRDRGDGDVHVFDEDSAPFQSRLLLSEDVARRFRPLQPLRQGPPAPILRAQQLHPLRSSAEAGDANYVDVLVCRACGGRLAW